MHEIISLHFRRYVLKNRLTGEAVAIVEADSIVQAESRGNLLKSMSGFFELDIDLVAENADIPMQLPTFLNSYFAMLETPLVIH